MIENYASKIIIRGQSGAAGADATVPAPALLFIFNKLILPSTQFLKVKQVTLNTFTRNNSGEMLQEYFKNNDN